MSKILVTGGAGFIGSHLCGELASLGHKVTSLDNYFTGESDNHIRNCNIRYIYGSTEQVSSLLQPEFDIVYHLGEYSRVEQSFEDIDLVWKFNKIGTYEILKFVNACGAKLIYAGSSTKFADMTDYMQSPYAWSKATNTEFVKQYAEWYDIDYAITYFYNVYGPREISTGKYATLIAKFKELKKNNKVLSVVLPGTQTRNFTYISDIIDALLLIGEEGHGDEYGIGDPQEYTINEVAEMFESPIEYLPVRKGNRLSAPVISKKTRILGWEPKHNLKNYINQLMKNGWKD